MWSKRKFLTVLGSLPFASILKSTKADTIIRKTYRGIKYTYTPEFEADLKAVYGVDIKIECMTAINTCLDIGCVGYDTTHFGPWPDGKIRKRIVDIVDGELRIQLD